MTTANVRLCVSDDKRQVDLLGRLRDKKVATGKVYQLFDELWFGGNGATQHLSGGYTISGNDWEAFVSI